MSPLLRLEHLRKCMGGHTLLDIGRFEIGEGECLLLSGRNGAGKSTLLKIIAGLEPPDRLDVFFRGQDLPWRKIRRQLQQEVVYLHQHPYMLDRSVADNVAYGLELAGLSRRAIRAKVEQALVWSDLTQLADRNARRLSGGEKQRAALARARVLSPKLLLLDEPFASLDLESREQGLLFIRRLKEEGIATVVTTHEPSVAQVLGDRHLHLCKTGPCRFDLVKPFLYERGQKRVPLSDPGVTASESTRCGIVGDLSVAARESPAVERDPAMHEMTGVILAGGLGRRMGDRDKGLLPLAGRPLVTHVIDAVRPQVASLVINANRNLESYRSFGLPVVGDMIGEFFGPLVGVASAMRTAHSPYVVSVPCDAPLVPADLCVRLYRALKAADADISVAHDGERMQPVFALLRRKLLPDLLEYLENGGRKIDTWYGEHHMTFADFSDRPEGFSNVNTLEELTALEPALLKASTPSR